MHVSWTAVIIIWNKIIVAMSQCKQPNNRLLSSSTLPAKDNGEYMHSGHLWA
jgi:hypothetical protein